MLHLNTRQAHKCFTIQEIILMMPSVRLMPYTMLLMSSLQGLRKNNSLINNLRNNGALDDYERGSFEFEDHVYEAIRENWDEYVEESLEQWDHKRGMCNLTAEVEVPRNLIAEAEEFAFSLGSGWTVHVKTDNGNLELEL
jgi:hypothetical protein